MIYLKEEDRRQSGREQGKGSKGNTREQIIHESEGHTIIIVSILSPLYLLQSTDGHENVVIVVSTSMSELRQWMMKGV